MGGKGSGGHRKNSGRIKGKTKEGIPYVRMSYRVPTEFKTECTKEIKQILDKYRKQCKTPS